MRCPHCKSARGLVIDSRVLRHYHRRRRRCSKCAWRWTTYEIDGVFLGRLLDAMDHVRGTLRDIEFQRPRVPSGQRLPSVTDY